MTLPYETATAGDKALIELQKALAKFGCQSFGTATDAERGMTIVHFKWRNQVVKLEASWKGYAAALMRERKVAIDNHDRRRRLEAEALEQAKKSVCSVLRDWTKAQITAVRGRRDELRDGLHAAPIAEGRTPRDRGRTAGQSFASTAGRESGEHQMKSH